MSFLRHRGVLLALAVLVVMPGAWLITRETAGAEGTLVTRVRRGEFVVTVTTAGELSARESVKIMAPDGVRQAQIYQIRISSLVPEGTLVDSGAVVADLDRSELASKQQEAMLALQKAEAVYEQAMLDSTLTLSQAREEIRSFDLAQEEARLALEQSRYEPPTVRRQAEIDVEKAQRSLDQAKLDYKTKVEQAQAKMREVGADVGRERNKLQIIQQVMQGFTVRAPAPGMVIYVKEWNGRKRTNGSQISSWDPTVATLPDLTKMESVTYVNEIDIRKVAVGQPVRLTLDSDPSKHLSGTVTSVANVGEQRPNTDAKVFEVRVKVAEADTTLRPGMTTANAIETLREDDVLSIPIEALNSDQGIAFVYRRQGGSVVRQEVKTGPMGENEVMIVAGLSEGDEVLLTQPANRADLAWRRLEGGDRAPDAGGDTALSVEMETAARPGR